jgi:hypothetical protein
LQMHLPATQFMQGFGGSKVRIHDEGGSAKQAHHFGYRQTSGGEGGDLGQVVVVFHQHTVKGGDPFGVYRWRDKF